MLHPNYEKAHFTFREDTNILIDRTYVNLKHTEFTILHAAIDEGERNFIDIEFTLKGMVQLEENIRGMARDNLKSLSNGILSDMTCNYLVDVVRYELEGTMTIEKEYEEEAYETIKRLITAVNFKEE